MFDIREYYKEPNTKVKDKYEKQIKALLDIKTKLESLYLKNEYYLFFYHLASLLYKLIIYEKTLDNSYFINNDFETLLKENNEHYELLLPSNYTNSYANPTYCVKIFGNNLGQLFSFFYTNVRRAYVYAFFHKLFKLVEVLDNFIEVFNYIDSNINKISYEELKNLIIKPELKDKTNDFVISINERYNPEFRYFKDIVNYQDLTDLRYLFRYGRYITNNEINIAKHLINYPEEKLKTIAKEIKKAYLKSFTKTAKSISSKSTVSISYMIGQEKLIKYLIEYLEEEGLSVLINDLDSTPVNKQYTYDHRFSQALYINEEILKINEYNYEEACKVCEKILKVYSGAIHFHKFGEKPFIPENKKEILQFTPKQQELIKAHQINIMNIANKYTPQSEISFSVISFPTPQIGDKFAQIFDSVLEINMLNAEFFENIQQKLIDVLDKADYIHIKGKYPNETDIKIKIQELPESSKYSNFLNIGADLNIPAGEIYTTPQLKGTNGLLHINETFLNGLKFIDLKLEFKNGWISNYSCKNFDNESENKKYIKDNLLFPYETLPLGEFAIGTNTYAYSTFKKYNIIHLLPVLLIEKLGPHFAIGDPCFIMQEDNKFLNPDKKEFIAKENEKTKTRNKEAYTYKHTDISLVYEYIEFIKVVTKDNEEIDILRDGKFALSEAQELNKYLI